MTRAIQILVAGLTLALAVAAPAHAASLTPGGYEADPGEENDLTVTISTVTEPVKGFPYDLVSPPGTFRIDVYDPGATVRITRTPDEENEWPVGVGCFPDPLDSHRASCYELYYDARYFSAFLGDLDDRVRTVGDGDFYVEAGAGNDVLSGEGRTTFDGEDGNDLLVGGDAGSWLSGGAGDDELRAGSGVASLDDGPGDDVVSGGPGDDTFATAAGGRDTFEGGAGSDHLSYGAVSTGVHADLEGDRDDGDNGQDLIGADFEDLTGSEGADVLLGSSAANELDGKGGDDRIEGYDGNDRISAGAGTDEAFGGAGDDAVNGGWGANDLVRGGDGNDSVDGHVGAGDQLYGDAGNDRLYPGEFYFSDQVEDFAHCGDGDDIAHIDPFDVVDPDCEATSSIRDI